LHFEVVYDVVRHEHLTLGLSRPQLENASLNKKDLRLFLGPDRLVPITGRLEKKDYFFGAHDANRVQFTIGRDLKLNPQPMIH
jgi:hypothetical protein